MASTVVYEESYDASSGSDNDAKIVPPPISWFAEEDTGSGNSTPQDEQQQQQQVEEQEEAPLPPVLPPSTFPDPDTALLPSQPKLSSVGSPFPAPSWNEISRNVLPAAARELLSNTLTKLCYSAKRSYALSRWQRNYSDFYNSAGYFTSELESNLPPFSSLSWTHRQLVKEWRTYLDGEEDGASDDEELEFDRARTLVPKPVQPPRWKKADSCLECHKTFGPTCLRHHCRLCGNSFCHTHSSMTHKLPHLGYHPDVPERVCDCCKTMLLNHNLAERIAWRLARCRDYESGTLQPYFAIGVDNLEDAALRITHLAIAMAKKIPLGAQATVAVETVDVLRKYGLKGIYTVMLRQEFLAAADLLLKALGIDRRVWPLSVHELSAAIFYALAQYRAMRGMNPEREHVIHAVSDTPSLEDEASAEDEQSVFRPVCGAVSDDELNNLIFFSPIALNFIYVEKEVDMQLLAAQQGWRLLYAYLDEENGGHDKALDRPASAFFIHEKEKCVCLAVRGTATVQDVITDIRQVPVPFPPDIESSRRNGSPKVEEDWTTVFRGQGLAVSGMAAAAVNLYREHVDSLILLAKQGYGIRLTGHSLGGAVATLLGVMLYKDLMDLFAKEPNIAPDGEPLRVYTYGTPSCVDLPLCDAVGSFVTTVVLHDDVIPRLTPVSCRCLMKHLLHIRETWVKEHFADDIRAFTDRAKSAWAPRWRGGFTLTVSSSSSIKRYCRKKLIDGRSTLKNVKERLVSTTSAGIIRDQELDFPDFHKWQEESIESESDLPVREEGTVSRPVMDIMGEMDECAEGIVVDGDEFFDPQEHIYASDGESVDENPLCSSSSVVSVGSSGYPHVLSDSEEKDFSCVDRKEMVDLEESADAVVLEESPLPQMFIPGRVVHIYSHRGVYNAASVPRNFRELRRISLAGNMLTDHKTNNYYDALLEVSSARRAPESPPIWTAFDEDNTCSCCASRFTWASTSDNEAQQARDKHNCRSCGSLVCNPCSSKRIPIPSIGIRMAVRVCDRCYNDIDGLVAETARSPEATRIETEETEGSKAERPIRHRQKRSSVVDDLASRVQSSVLTTCTF